MDTYDVDDAISLALLLNERVASAEHRLKTPDCPTIPELEQMAANAAQWNLKQWLHTNNCPYCQLTIKLFREEMGIKPRWERWREKAAQAFEVLNLGVAAGDKQLVPAVLLDAGPEPKQVTVEVVTARFTSDQCGRLRFKLEKQLPGVKPETPIEMMLVTHPEAEPLGEFLFPMLNFCQEERLKVWLPPDAHEAWRKLNAPAGESKRELPFRFVLRPGGELPEE
jgi:hypothetical protein